MSKLSRAWWHMPIISALRKLRKEDTEFKPIMHHISKDLPQNKKPQNITKNDNYLCALNPAKSFSMDTTFYIPTSKG